MKKATAVRSPTIQRILAASLSVARSQNEAQTKARRLTFLQWVIHWAQIPWSDLDGTDREDEELLEQVALAEFGEMHVQSDDLYPALCKKLGVPLPARQPYKALLSMSPLQRLHHDIGQIIKLAASGKNKERYDLPPLQLAFHATVAKSVGLDGKHHLLPVSFPVGDVYSVALLTFFTCLSELGEDNICRCPECPSVFVRSRKQLFCSPRCASRATSRTYRQKHPEKHKRSAAIAMRKVYEKNLRSKFGERKFHVQHHKRKY